MSDQWQPIETAPRDGTTVIVAFPLYNLVSNGLDVTAARYRSATFLNADVSGWVQLPDERGVETIWPPTHWQPLPNPPQAEEAPLPTSAGEETA
ncbi:hypothetical protein [Rhizobium hidalgonense]|uniref:hypothetical protein n=1 Tax=Rhizobium hidalgonense TaxID=1538159 RepID=UPI0035C724D8